MLQPVRHSRESVRVTMTRVRTIRSFGLMCSFGIHYGFFGSNGCFSQHPMYLKGLVKIGPYLSFLGDKSDKNKRRSCKSLGASRGFDLFHSLKRRSKN